MLIELLQYKPAREEVLADGSAGTALINPDQIAMVRSVWEEDGVWTHCVISLTGGHSIRVNASFEQIEQAIAAAQEQAA